MINHTQILIHNKTRFELFKLKPVAPMQHNKKSFDDVVVFLIDYYKKNEEAKK